jgi:hypothetical protein
LIQEIAETGTFTILPLNEKIASSLSSDTLTPSNSK